MQLDIKDSLKLSKCKRGFQGNVKHRYRILVLDISFGTFQHFLGFQDEGAEVAGAAQQGKKVHLKCSQCKEVFSQAWDLMFHAQNAHGVNIYKLSEKNNSESNAAAP